jgi:hypothetical protein
MASNGDAYSSGAALIATTMAFGAAYYGADILNSISFKENGTLLGITQQMGAIRSSGQGVQSSARGGTQQGVSTVESTFGGGGKVVGAAHDRFGVVGKQKLADAKAARLNAKGAKGG